MARLIYAFLALALGTLVAGFLIRDSSVPLFVSIGLSGLVLVMILFGTSRRLRRDAERGEDEAELAELEIVELDEEPEPTAADEQPTIAVPPRRRKPVARSRPREIGAPAPVMVEDEPTIVDPEPPATPRRRARPAASRRAEATAPAPTVATDEPAPDRAPRRTRASGRPARSSDAATTPAPAVAAKVWVIPGRSRYHARNCRFAKGDQLREVTEATARRRGYVPCSVCHPDQASG